MSLKKTPLYSLYEKLGAKTIEYNGWELPVYYSGIKDEHLNVRKKAGLFDISHMGEILVYGDDSQRYLQYMLTNDLSNLKKGDTVYSSMCYEHGGTVDDLLVYKLDENKYLLVVNAANKDKDFSWLQKNASGEVIIEDLTAKFAMFALQGPKSKKILGQLVNISELRVRKFTKDTKINDVDVLISRTGYTGEDGYEIYCHSKDAILLWNTIIDTGKKEGLKPCGLGARDTLRFEAGFPLYGQELSESISPLEAGIEFTVKWNKEFIGKSALQLQKESEGSRKIVGLEMIDRGIPRHGYKVFADGKEIGIITSGNYSPTLKKNLGFGLVPKQFCEIGSEVEVEIRGKHLKAKVVPIPFYKLRNK